MATLKEMIAADIAARNSQKKPSLMDALRNSARVIDDGLLGGAFQRIPAEANRLMQRAKAAPGELNALASPQMRQTVNTAMAKPAPANPQQWMDAGMELSGMAPFMGMVAHTVYHGSPHKFDKFDMSKIGTGEGAQAYGHGLYFAEAPDVAKGYAEALTKARVQSAQSYLDRYGGNVDDAILSIRGEINHLKGLRLTPETGAAQQAKKISFAEEKLSELLAYKNQGAMNQGNFYKVDIPDETIPRMLDWDKPLSEQSAEVQAALANTKNKQLRAMVDYASAPYSTPELAGEVKTMGEAIKLMGMNASPAKGSALLAKHGIPGIRYLDGNSRGAGGTSNYVLFDDQLPRILEVNGVPTGLEPWPKNKLWPK